MLKHQARPDEFVRTGVGTSARLNTVRSGKSSGLPQKKIEVPARAGSDGNGPAAGVPQKITMPHYYPGILVMYFSICFIWSFICCVVGFKAFALRKYSLPALNSLLFIMMEESCK